MKITEKFVFFWGTTDSFSNFHPAPFEYKGNNFLTSEQFINVIAKYLIQLTQVERERLP
ncbi:hypothetical protein MELB17_09518 [Marinobacter sp. ELB17]|nr:hypothetical protein MELB17_09518 [Marinobacter sp. ELB17]